MTNFLGPNKLSKRNIILLLVVIAFGALAWLYFPSDNEMTPASRGKSGPPIVQVKVPKLDATMQQGEQLFGANCASCHGKNAAGQDGVAPPLIHKIYEPNHHGDRAFYSAAMNGVRAHHWPFGDMPPVDGVSTNDLKQIVAYVRVLQRANGIQ